MYADERPVPSYLALAQSGVLARRAHEARRRLEHCDLCPRECGANRIRGELGFCGALDQVRVASWHAHHWEEPPISGTRGSGTIFFSHCTARCIFCQNYPISQLGVGRDILPQRLAGLMLELQAEGCHNINLVTPTHYVPQILQALQTAVSRGFRLPLLYNTGGYDRVETLELLDGVVDIYLPDAKYADDRIARSLSAFEGYAQHNQAALLEMKRQVGAALQVDAQGIAHRGMVVRHLVLPHRLSQTREVLEWLADNLGREVYISLMAQYFPAHRAVEHPQLERCLLPAEYQEALDALERAGLENGWQQSLDQAL